MKSTGAFCLILVVTAVLLAAGCTSSQPATVSTPVATTSVSTVTATTAPVTVKAVEPGQLLADKVWKVISWKTEPALDMNNTSVKSFLAEYNNHANDTFTWYTNGTLVYRNVTGVAYTTGNWTLVHNNTVIAEKYTTSDGFYQETQNEILVLNTTTLTIRYPASIGGKTYYFIEVHRIL